MVQSNMSIKKLKQIINENYIKINSIADKFVFKLSNGSDLVIPMYKYTVGYATEYDPFHSLEKYLNSLDNEELEKIWFKII